MSAGRVRQPVVVRDEPFEVVAEPKRHREMEGVERSHQGRVEEGCIAKDVARDRNEVDGVHHGLSLKDERVTGGSVLVNGQTPRRPEKLGAQEV